MNFRHIQIHARNLTGISMGSDNVGCFAFLYSSFTFIISSHHESLFEWTRAHNFLVSLDLHQNTAHFLKKIREQKNIIKNQFFFKKNLYQTGKGTIAIREKHVEMGEMTIHVNSNQNRVVVWERQ
jgi:hypothetical protein